MSELPDGLTTFSSPMNGVAVDTPLATASLLLHGAHLIEWAPTDQSEVIWLSSQSEFGAGVAVRGGVPICFPWFGDGRHGEAPPKHGWARNVSWQLTEARVDEAGDAVLTLSLPPEARAGRPGAEALGDAVVEHHLTIGTTLVSEVVVRAVSNPVDVEAALHTYLAVSDIEQTHVQGLDAADYLDKVAGTSETQSGDVTFTGETDRVYDRSAPAAVVTPERTIDVTPHGATKTIVWNPWRDKAAAMTDFGDDEWRGMVCVETACALDKPIRLQPGESHTMGVTLGVR